MMDYLKLVADNIGWFLMGGAVLILGIKYLMDIKKFKPVQKPVQEYYPQRPSAPADPFRQEATINVLDDLQKRRDGIISKLNSIKSEADSLPVQKRNMEEKHKNDLYFLDQRYETLKKEWQINNAQLQTVNELLSNVRM